MAQLRETFLSIERTSCQVPVAAGSFSPQRKTFSRCNDLAPSYVRSPAVRIQRIRGRSIYSGAPLTDTRPSLMLRPGRELEFVSINCGREIRFAWRHYTAARIHVIIGGQSETGRIGAFISARARDTRRASSHRRVCRPARSRRDVLDIIPMTGLLQKLDSRFVGKRNI